MGNISLRQKIFVISTLYISQSVPVAFIKTGFQVFLKENNLSYAGISGIMGLLLLPWTFKFLWAPAVDRFSLGMKQQRKSWIVPLQILGIAVLVLVAFLEPQEKLLQISLLFLLYSFISATQDIAVDGLAVVTLSKKEHGIGNSMQMGGYYLGELLGGAVLLILLGVFGWTVAILTLAFLFGLPLISLWGFKEPECPVDKDAPKFMGSIKAWFAENESAWVVLLMLYTGNQVLARTLLPSLLQDNGLSKESIGVIIGVWGNAASLAGAILGGIAMNKMGRKRSIINYGILKIFALASLFLITIPKFNLPLTLVAILCNDFVAGLCTVTLFTVMMDKCSLNRPGSDFTIQQSLNSFGILVFVIISGVFIKFIGFNGLFAVSIALAVISLVVARYGVNWAKVEVSETLPEVKRADK